MKIEFPRGAERAYLEDIGIAAVYIASGGGFGNACAVGATRDLERSWLALREVWQCPDITGAWWVKSRAIAEEIVRAVARRLPNDGQGLLDADVIRAQAEIGRAAQSMGVTLTEHATVVKRAGVASLRIRDALNAANQCGELAWFNQAYRDHRRQQGGRAINYAAARAGLCHAMGRRLVLVERVEFGPEMLVEVFGAELSTTK